MGNITKATTIQNILENIFQKLSNNTCNKRFTAKNISNKEEHEQVCKRNQNISHNSSASSNISMTVNEIYKTHEIVTFLKN